MPLTKEAYKKLNDNTDGVRFIRPFSEYTLQEVIDALTELEGLKIDVKRYIELIDLDDLITDEQIAEQLELHLKFQKVGDEDV